MNLPDSHAPNELLQEIRSKGDAFYYSIQVRKCDYTDRAISTSIPLEIPFAVNITSPNGNEVIATGDNYDITWETNAASNEILYVELSYSTNDGDTWDLIAMQPGNSGTYEWEIPTFTKNMTNCRIKLQAFDSNLKRLGIDKSDNPFTIEVMKVTSPDGEDSLISGDMYSITWMSNSTKDPVDKVKIKFTKNGGKTWETVANVIGNPEEYVWRVPGVSKTKKKCRVTAVQKDSAGNTVGKATSEGYFTIEPKP